MSGCKPRRRQPHREIKPRMLIVTEGETECEYFKALRILFPLMPLYIKCVTSRHSDPVHVVEESQRIIKDSRDNQFSCAFAVFDMEGENGNPARVKDAIALAAVNPRKGDIRVRAVISNPSIEYWILLHFKEVAMLLKNAERAESELKKEWPNFKKGMNFSALIRDENRPDLMERVKLACDRAKKIQRQYFSDNGSFDPLTCNPSTQVHELVGLFIIQ